MPEGHGRPLAGAPRHLEPRQKTRGRSAGAFLARKIHQPLGRAKAQARQRIDNHTQPVGPCQPVMPLAGRVAVHGAQKKFQVGAAQRLLHFSCQRQGLRRCPLRQHARMHHQPTVALQRHGAVPQPVQQRFAVGRLQDVLHGIVTAWLAHALPQRQQVQIMVAQQALRRVAQRHQLAQQAQRVGSAVDQIAQQVHGVAASGKINLLEQALKWQVAALQVADTVK